MQGAGLLDEVMTLLCSHFSDYVVIFHFNLFFLSLRVEVVETMDGGHAVVSYLTIGSLAVGSCCSAVCDTAEDVNRLVWRWYVGSRVLRSSNTIGCPVSCSPGSP